MSKKTVFIFIIFLILLIAGVFVYYLFFTKDNNGTTPAQALKISDFFPFGQNQEAVPMATTTPNIDTKPVFDPNAPVPKLRKISTSPISGAIAIENSKGVIARYLEKATGHIYEAELFSNIEPNRISNTTIPKIYEALWTNNGEGLIIRYINPDNNSDDIKNLYLKLDQISELNATSTNTKGSFLPDNVDIALSPKQDRIFTLGNTGEIFNGNISQTDGTKGSNLFQSPFVEWLASWPEEGTITLTTKPSFQFDGLLYFVNTKTKTVTRILGGIAGLTTLTNNNGFVLYNEPSPNSDLPLSVLNTKTNENTSLTTSTLPEKCIWSKLEKNILYCAVPKNQPTGNYPDDWYQGLISFNDYIEKIDIVSGNIDVISDLEKESGIAIDATHLQLSPKEDYLIFTNKKDSSLWSLILEKNISQN